MNEQEKMSILQSLRAQLTGNLHADLQFLEAEAAKYAANEETKAVVADIVAMAEDLLPQEHKDFMQKTIYIGNRRLDQVYAEAARLITNHQSDKSLVLTTQLYQKIQEAFPETTERRFFSFRNLLEVNLYYQMYHPTKHLEKTPFDFVKFISAHAYNLIELHRAEEAIPVLEEAIRYNPVNPEPRFELAEACKVLSRPDLLLAVIKETIPICATPYALARCYSNMGYYCVEQKDYENAVCFYFESLIYADHPAIPAELQHVSRLMGKKIAPPKRVEVLAAFEKYGIPNGADPNVLGVARALANQAVEKHEWEPAAFYLRVIADLTNDEEARTLQKHCEDQLKKEQTADAGTAE